METRKGVFLMEGIVINIMKKAKKPTASKNMAWHNSQMGKPTGNRDDNYKKYNFDALTMQGEETISNYNKYFKEHAHIGYNAHKEELRPGDFVVPRDNDTITKIESIVVAPPVKVLVKDIDRFDFAEVQCFFDDYIHSFIKRDSRFKDIKILSAKVHCNEVYYPRFEEITQPDGTTRLRRLSREESIDKAYIKVHMHLDYIPLVQVEKDGIKYLKLSSKELWKADKGRYFSSYSQFNDRFYSSIGKSYGLDRGQKWEEWDLRIQKKNNGELVKENRDLSDWQMDIDEELKNRYIAQLEEERAKYEADTEQAKMLMEEIEMQRKERYQDFLKMQQQYKKELEELERKEERLRQKIQNTDEQTRQLVHIEVLLQNHKMTKQEAIETIKALGLDDKIMAFSESRAKQYAPNLYQMARNDFGDDER